MKHKRLLLLLLAVFVRPALYGQLNCTNPPNCIQNPGTNSNGSPVIGQPINFADLTGWDKLSGIPKYGPGMAMSTGIQLANGDGVRTCYNFRAGVTYHLCFWARNANTTTTGNIILEANNGAGGSYTIWNTSLSSPFNFYPGTTYQNYQRTFTIPAGGGFNELRIYTTGVTGAYAVVFDDIQVTEQPILTATPSTINACQSTELRASSNNNDLDVTWSNTATLTPSSGIGTTVTARPCSTSVYTATYKSQCPLSCGNNTAQVTVTVNPMTANISASPATITPCSAGATLTATSSSPVTVSWTPTTGLTPASGIGAVVNANPCTTTVYTATYVCTASGCTTSRNVTVTVNESGTTATASPGSITAGCQNATLTASSTNNMPVTWAPAAGLNQTSGPVVTASPCSSATYVATFACAANGCIYKKPVGVTVLPGPGIINPSATIPCRSPIKMYFAGNGCTTNTYKWIGPRGGTILSTTDTLYIPSPAPGDQGTYILEVTTQKGCITMYNTVVTMTNCCNIIGDFTIVGCNPIRLINNTTMDGVPVIQGEWYWDFGDGNVSTIRNPSHRYTQSLAPRRICMTVVAFDSSGISTCCDKVCKDLVVCSYATDCDPRAAFDFNVVNPVTNSVQLIDKSIGAGAACGWVWHVDAATIPGTADSSPVVTMTPGLHTVCLRVKYCLNGGTCEEEWCEQVIIP